MRFDIYVDIRARSQYPRVPVGRQARERTHARTCWGSSWGTDIGAIVGGSLHLEDELEDQENNDADGRVERVGRFFHPIFILCLQAERRVWRRGGDIGGCARYVRTYEDSWIRNVSHSPPREQ